jgi:hypothetical protein
VRVCAYTRYSRSGASSRLRLYQFIPLLAELGIDVDVFPLFSDVYISDIQRGARRSAIEISRSYLNRWSGRQETGAAKSIGTSLGDCISSVQPDAIWVEKECFPWLPLFAETSFLPQTIPFVLDFDDAVFHLYGQHQNAIVRALLGEKLTLLMRMASVVVCGNRYLADYATDAKAKHVEILPTVVDCDRYLPKGVHDQTDLVVTRESAMRSLSPQPLPRIGWIGQRSTAHFLQPLAGLLADLFNHGIAQAVAIGLNATEMGLPMASLPWSEEGEVAALQSLDIGIMPLSDGPFERGKCGYKLIQYMACGLPVVASPVGVNCELVKQGVNGFLADSPQDWRESLTTLCKDAALRQQMGAAGRKLVESQFSLAAMAPKLAHIFRELAHASQP